MICACWQFYGIPTALTSFECNQMVHAKHCYKNISQNLIIITNLIYICLYSFIYQNLLLNSKFIIYLYFCLMYLSVMVVSSSAWFVIMDVNWVLHKLMLRLHFRVFGFHRARKPTHTHTKYGKYIQSQPSHFKLEENARLKCFKNLFDIYTYTMKHTLLKFMQCSPFSLKFRS